MKFRTSLLLIALFVGVAALSGCAESHPVADSNLPTFNIGEGEARPARDQRHHRNDAEEPTSDYPLKIAANDDGELEVQYGGSDGLLQKQQLIVTVDDNEEWAYVPLHASGKATLNNERMAAARSEFERHHQKLAVVQTDTDVAASGMLWTGEHSSEEVLVGLKLHLRPKFGQYGDMTLVGWHDQSQLTIIPKSNGTTFGIQKADAAGHVNIRFDRVVYTPAVRDAMTALMTAIVDAGNAEGAPAAHIASDPRD
ncbi:hypothetical protein CL628_02075 [bacterium]|nr:hypothetical protein [bacterium]